MSNIEPTFDKILKSFQPLSTLTKAKKTHMISDSIWKTIILPLIKEFEFDGDVIIVYTTNRELSFQLDTGSGREDFYYWLEEEKGVELAGIPKWIESMDSGQLNALAEEYALEYKIDWEVVEQ